MPTPSMWRPPMPRGQTPHGASPKRLSSPWLRKLVSIKLPSSTPRAIEVEAPRYVGGISSWAWAGTAASSAYAVRASTRRVEESREVTGGIGRRDVRAVERLFIDKKA